MPYDVRPAELPLDIEECRTAIWMSNGNISAAAEILKTDSGRLRKFVKNSPYLSMQMEEAAERKLDLAEENLYDALTDTEDKARKDAASKYVLSNLGQSRGYNNGKGSSPNINLNGPKGRIVIQWEDGTSFDAPKTIEGEVVDVS